MTEERIRSIIKETFGYTSNAGSSMGYTGSAPDYNPPDPEDIEVTDDTVGVMDFTYEKNDVDIEAILDKLKPYLEDIEVQYIGLNDEFELVSLNVKHKYKDLLISLMSLFGLELDSETFGDEMRGSKKTYGPKIMSPVGGVHGRFSLPYLIGEIPGGTMFENKKHKK